MEKKNEESAPRNDDGETQIHYKGWKAMPFVIGEVSFLFCFLFCFMSFVVVVVYVVFHSGNETFEKLGAIGTLANLLIYLTTVFNMKSITAATLLNIFNGSTNLVTLVGAFLCDTYFGRYKILGFSIVASFLVLFFTYVVTDLNFSLFPFPISINLFD